MRREQQISRRSAEAPVHQSHHPRPHPTQHYRACWSTSCRNGASRCDRAVHAAAANSGRANLLPLTRTFTLPDLLPNHPAHLHTTVTAACLPREEWTGRECAAASRDTAAFQQSPRPCVRRGGANAQYAIVDAAGGMAHTQHVHSPTTPRSERTACANLPLPRHTRRRTHLQTACRAAADKAAAACAPARTSEAASTPRAQAGHVITRRRPRAAQGRYPHTRQSTTDRCTPHASTSSDTRERGYSASSAPDSSAPQRAGAR